MKDDRMRGKERKVSRKKRRRKLQTKIKFTRLRRGGGTRNPWRQTKKQGGPDIQRKKRGRKFKKEKKEKKKGDWKKWSGEKYGSMGGTNENLKQGGRNLVRGRKVGGKKILALNGKGMACIRIGRI